MMKLLLFLTVVVFVCFDQVYTIKWRCDDKAETQIDQIIARMMVFGTDRKFPEARPDVKKFCSEQKEMWSKIEAYKDACLKDQPKQIFSVLSYAVKNAFNRICKNPNSKQTLELLSSLPCANAGSPEFDKCILDFTSLLEATKNMKDYKEILAQLCCGYTSVFGCLREKSKHVKACTAKRTDGFLDFFKSISDNAMNMVCGDYNDSSDKCDHVKLVKRKNSSKNTKSKSFIKPLVYIFSNI